MNNEYMTNMFIDSIQNAKKTFVDTWIKDEAMSAPMHAFIKVQSEFTKEALKQTNLIANAAGEAMSKVAK
jgi:glutamyl-tRNA reductase